MGACKREDFVGICGFSSLDWITADYANTYCGKSHWVLPTAVAHFVCTLACTLREGLVD